VGAGPPADRVQITSQTGSPRTRHPPKCASARSPRPCHAHCKAPGPCAVPSSGSPSWSPDSAPSYSTSSSSNPGLGRPAPPRRALVNARRPGESASSESGAEARGGPPGLTGRASTTSAVAASTHPTAKQRTPGGAREAERIGRGREPRAARPRASTTLAFYVRLRRHGGRDLVSREHRAHVPCSPATSASPRLAEESPRRGIAPSDRHRR
jgi:hypothetical protein